MSTQNATVQEDKKPIFDSVDDLAAHIGLSRHSTYMGLRNRDIPSLRVGKRFIIPKAAIAEWLKSAGRVTS
jgi:excisionase family DNA binding protein